MSNKQYSFTQKQKRTLYLVTGLIWLLGIAILHYFDGLSLLSFVALSLVLIGSSSYTYEIKWWVNIAIIVLGIFWISMSYLEQNDPIGVAGVTEWWILGVTSILVGIYWLVQKTVARFQVTCIPREPDSTQKAP
jgi:hypothetical protein